MWGAWCKTLVGGFSLGEWEPLCPRPTLPEAACNTAGGLGGAVSPPAGSGRERILAIMYIKFASCAKKNPLWGAPNCGGPGAAAPFAPFASGTGCVENIITSELGDSLKNNFKLLSGYEPFRTSTLATWMFDKNSER